jgi:hypothetical protein
MVLPSLIVEDVMKSQFFNYAIFLGAVTTQNKQGDLQLLLSFFLFYFRKTPTFHTLVHQN